MRMTIIVGAIGLLMVGTGCVGTSADRGIEALQESTSTAWALDAASIEPVVAVSPAQRSLRIAGSAGTVIGTGITAVENDRYRRMVLEGLGDYSPGDLFETYLRDSLTEAFGDNEVAPLGSTAGYHSRREVVDARYERIAESGHESLLDVKMTQGLFGPRAIMAVSLESVLVTLPGGGRRYAHEIVALPGPLLANAAKENPMGGVLPDFGENLISVESGTVEKWLAKSAHSYKITFETLMHDVVAALLTELGQIDDARGHYTLGRQALRDGDPEAALASFDRALAMDASFVEAASARSVAFAEAERYDEAIAAAETVLATSPDYGPAHFNLAWWYAVKLEQPESARVHYAKAQELGMPAARKIDKALD